MNSNMNSAIRNTIPPNIIKAINANINPVNVFFKNFFI